jgi:hypothetical protein
MSIILLTLRIREKRENAREIIAFFIVNRSISTEKLKRKEKKLRKEKEKNRENRMKIDHFNFHNTI